MLRAIVKVGIVRQLHKSSVNYGASIFNMPAMSPTMTEGGIVEWKFKSGDSFQAGDVLLEVETDKATIDVEAQDDGKIFEIIKSDGDKGIPVGSPIAILAEPEDDLSTLAKPKLEETKQPVGTEQSSKEKQPQQKKDTKPESSPITTSTSTSSTSSIFVDANPNQTFSPSVDILLHENNISREDALKTIKASGPKGRILKGDVLAHLGKVNTGTIESLTKFLLSKQHLDLSNIVLATPVAPAAEAATAEAAATPPKPQNILNVSFQGILGELSPEQFRFATQQSIKSANILTYKHAFPSYNNGPVATPQSASDIFDELLVAPPSKSRFEIANLNFDFNQTNSSPPPSDIFDELLGFSAKETAPVPPPSSPSTVEVSFNIKYDLKQTDSRQFVDYFTQSLLSQIPSTNVNVNVVNA